MMTIKDAEKILNGRLVSCPEKALNEIKGVYTCDFLSWAMSKLRADDMWITIQTNNNIIAVADLKDAALIVIPEGLTLEDELIKTASEKDVAIMLTDYTAFEVCREMGKYL